LSPQPSSCT